jgi:hypothetical protein
MKKTLLIISAALLVSTGLLGQKKNNIKTDLFSPILRTGTLKFERAFTEDVSFQIGFFYTGYSPRETESTLNGFGITPELRYYLSETPAPNGTYLAPNIRYYNFTVSDPVVDEEGTLTNISLAINLGKQVLLKDLVLIDAWVGPSYNFRSLSATSPDFSTGIADANGFGLRFGIAIGLAF